MRKHVSNRAVLAALVGLAALIGSVGSTVSAQGDAKETSADKIKVTAAVAKADASGNQVITLTIDVDKGWHIYANPIEYDEFDGNKTIVTVASKGKPLPAKVMYPAGKLHYDKYLNHSYRIYEGQVAIQATVQRAEGAGPLDVSVKVNACTEKKCLLTGVKQVTVP